MLESSAWTFFCKKETCFNRYIRMLPREIKRPSLGSAMRNCNGFWTLSSHTQMKSNSLVFIAIWDLLLQR